jgi:hypothetical protein
MHSDYYFIAVIIFTPLFAFSMASSNPIIILSSTDKSYILSRKQEYASIDPGYDDDQPSPQGIISHEELVRIKEKADKNIKAVKKRKISIIAVVICALIVLTIAIYFSVQFVKTSRP